MAICQLCSVQLQNEMTSDPKTAQLFKKCVAPKKAIAKKSFEIQGGSQ